MEACFICGKEINNPLEGRNGACNACIVKAVFSGSENTGLYLCPFCGALPAMLVESCGGHNEGNRHVVQCGCGAKVVGSFYQNEKEARTPFCKNFASSTPTSERRYGKNKWLG